MTEIHGCTEKGYSCLQILSSIALIVCFTGVLCTIAIDSYYEVEMIVTAYCPCDKCCGDFADGVTASGKPAVGFLVAAPSEYPFGTRMAIHGYNNGDPVPVLDRGGAIKGNKIDLLFPDHDSALNWGRKTMKVRVYK